MLKTKNILTNKNKHKTRNKIPKNIKNTTKRPPFLCLLLSCGVFITQPVHGMMGGNEWSDHDWDKLFYKPHQGVLLGPRILGFLESPSLGRAAQVNKQWHQLVDHTKNARLDDEKQALYALILEVTEAHPNEVQWAHDHVDHYLETETKNGKQGSDLCIKLTALRPRLLQPESLVRANDSLLKNLLSTNDLSETHPALKPLVTLIKDLEGMIPLPSSESNVEKVLTSLKAHYEAYISQFLLPSCNRALHLHPKALLSGDGFLGDKHGKGITSYRITQDMARFLLSKDEYGLCARANQQGSHAVSFKRSQIDPTWGVHFKGNTTNTGLPVARESAVHAFSQILFPQSISHGRTAASSLLCLNEVEIKTPLEGTNVNKAFREALRDGKTSEEFFNHYPLYEKDFTQKDPHHVLQASFHVEGVSLEDFIEGADKGAYAYDSIDLSSFSEHIFLSMLINPTDGTPGNFMLRKNERKSNQENETFSIVGIDNDMALELGDTFVENIQSKFIPGQKMTTQQKHSVRVKNIIYCLPLMNNPLSPQIVKRILALNPELMALQWLEYLKHHNVRYHQLQNGVYHPDRSQHTSEHYLSPTQIKDLHLPFLLDPDFTPTFCQTIRKIQTYLTDYKAATHWQLLLNIHPLSARFYQEMVKRAGNSVLGAYLKIDPRYKKHDPSIPERNVIYLEDFLTLEEKLLNGQTIAECLKDVTTRSDGTQHFIQSPHEAATQLLSTTDLLQQPFLASFLRPALGSFGELIQGASGSGLEPKLEHNPAYQSQSIFNLTPQLHSSWFKNSLLHKAISEGVSLPHLQRLLELGLDVTAMDKERRTMLRYAVEKGADPSFLSLLMVFCPKDYLQSWINTIASDRLTALDIALENKDISAFKVLSDHGGFICQPTIALKFYQNIIQTTQDKVLKQAFLKLMQTNEEVRWYVCLHEMLPAVKAGHRGQSIATAKFLKRTLPQEIKDQIMRGDTREKNHHWISYSQEGNHTVCRATCMNKIMNIEHSLYFKVYPELAGIEEAAGLLTRKLLGFGAPHTELIKIDGTPVLVSYSHGDKNKTLDYMLRHHPHLLKNLDEESLSGLILVAMLINPEDGKPTNYVVEPHPTNPKKYRIVGVDNDHAFVPAFVMEKPQNKAFSQKPIPVAQVKTVLYCLDQMKDLVHPNVRNLFINLRPDELLDEWLRELKKVNTSYSDLFPDAQDHKKFFKNHECFLGIPFQKGAISHLYDKLIDLRNILSGVPGITHLELLAKLEPRLAKRYQLASVLRTVKERWDAVDAGFYEKTKTSLGTTLTRSGDILRSMSIPLEESVLESIRLGKNLGPLQALEELKSIKEELQTKTLESLGVRAGDLNLLKTLQLESTRAQFLEMVDFKTLTQTEQEAILEYLKDKQLRRLTLKNCQSLNDKRFTQGFSLKHLTKLDVRGCEKITYQSLAHLSQVTLNLEELNLANITSLQEIGDIGAFRDAPLVFSKLRFLNLSNCIKLTKLLIQVPKLHYLNIENCALLTDQMLDRVIRESKNLKTLVLRGTSKISGISYRGEHPTFTLLETNFSLNDQFNQGCKYWFGEGVAQDHQEAFKWLLNAAVQGHSGAQSNLGWMYQYGRGTLRDDKEAVRWYQKAADQADTPTQFYLGLMYDKGEGVFQDAKEAMRWYQKAADQGHAKAQFNLGNIYREGRGVPENAQEAFKWYFNAALQGHAGAQLNLGVMYAKGCGVSPDDKHVVEWLKKDYQQALGWYQKAADQNEGYAQANVGRMYKEGLGTGRKLGLALFWITKSSEQNNTLGFYQLALLYRDGEGVDRDNAKALSLLQKAAEKNHSETLYTLGWMHENGRGTPIDLEKAKTYYEEGTKRHAEDALYSIGRIYEYGLGGEPVNLLEAKRWYQKAADVHYEPAFEKLKALEGI